MKSFVIILFFNIFLSFSFSTLKGQSNFIYIDQNNNLVHHNTIFKLPLNFSPKEYSNIKKFSKYVCFYIDGNDTNLQEIRYYFYFDIFSRKISLGCKQYFDKTPDFKKKIIKEIRPTGIKIIDVSDNMFSSIESEITKLTLGNVFFSDFYNGDLLFWDADGIYIIKKYKNRIQIINNLGNIKDGGGLICPSFSTNGNYITYIKQTESPFNASNVEKLKLNRSICFYDIKNKKILPLNIKLPKVVKALLNEKTKELMIFVQENETPLLDIFIYNMHNNKFKYINKGFAGGWI